MDYRQRWGTRVAAHLGWRNIFNVLSLAKRRQAQLLAALIFIASLLATTFALATTYYYDANGRVVAVTNDAGESAQYVYDALGNLTSVSRPAVGDPAIFGFSPVRGAPGVTVTVRGQGFSGTPTSNTVRFNGAKATVSTATPTLLTAVVPATATTGPITIKVGTKTATGPMDFVVDANARPPVITTVAPLIAQVDTPITVNGTDFYPTIDQTRTLLNSRPVSLSTVANTQLSFPVPINTGSGKVTVVSPFGSGTSAQDVLVIPTGIVSTAIVDTKRGMIDGTALSFSVPLAQQYGAELFDGNADDLLSLQFTDIGSNIIAYTLYGVDNKSIVSWTVSAATPSVHLPPLPATGTYLLLMKSTNASATWNVAIERNKAVLNDSNTISIATTVVSQSKRLVFAATIGQNLGIGLSGLMTPGSTSLVDARLYAPNGTEIYYRYCYATSGGCDFNIANAVTGLYTVIIKAPAGGAGTFSLNATLSSDKLGALAADVPLAISLSRNGQNGRWAFPGTAGQSRAIQVVGQTTLPAGKFSDYTVYKPDGTFLTSTSADSNKTLLLPNLPTTGTYTLFVSPSTASTLNSTVIYATGSSLTPNGTTASFTTTTPGQPVFFTFTASVGQNLQLGISELTTPGTTSYADISVFEPSGSTIVSHQDCYASDGGCDLLITNTVSGTYSVVATAPTGGNGTMSFKATLSTEKTGAFTPEIPQLLTLDRPGQTGRWTFPGVAGQVPAFLLSNQATVPTGKPVYYTVYKPDGTFLTSTSTTAPSTNWTLPSLPVSGTYTLVVAPSFAATLSVQATFATGTAGGMVFNGASGVFNTMPGQAVYLTFPATAGANIEFGISEIVTPGTTSALDVHVYKPTGNELAAQDCRQTYGGCDYDIEGATAGTYSVVINPPPSGNGTMSFKTTASSESTGAMTLDVPITLSITRPGQNARFSFAGVAGQIRAIPMGGQSTLPVGKSVSYKVLKPDGTVLVSTNTTTGKTLLLSSLPVNGTYNLLVDPDYAATSSAQVMLASGTAGGMVLNGGSGVFTATTPSLPVYLTFPATAGANYGFGISELQTPGSTSLVDVRVYKPDGTQAYFNNCYASFGGCDFDIVNTVAGTYSVVIVPPSDGTGSLNFKATVSTDQPGTLALDVPKALTLARPGENARLTFTGAVGQYRAIQIGGQATTPSNQSVYYAVYKPDGMLLSWTNTTLGAAVLLPSLPTAGPYTVLVDPDYAATASVQITLATGTAGGMVLNGASGVFNTSAPGLPIYLTFPATSGANLGFGLSEVMTPGSTSLADVRVYKPDGSQLEYKPCYQTPGGCDSDIANATAGTYSVLIKPPTDGAGTMSFKSTVSSDQTGSLTPDVLQSLNLSRPAQNARWTFNGTSGQLLALLIGAQVTVPAGQSSSYKVYKPDGTELASTTTTTGKNWSLPSLPVTGPYVVFVDPASAATLTANLTLDTTP